MTIFEVGRMCMKIAGRDAGKKCVVVEKVDNIYVVVDGATRRKKVNVRHLEPLNETVDIKDKASHSDVEKAFEKLDIKVWNTKKKESKDRPKKAKVKKEKPVKAKKAKKESVEKVVDKSPMKEVKEEKKEESKKEEKKD